MGQDYERDRFPVRGPTVGVIDSGFALLGGTGPGTGHVDLNKNAVGWDLWGGGCGSVYCDEASTGFHGSHVLGSVCGLGSAIFANRGFSPYVGNNGGTQRIFLVKGLTTNAFQYMRNNYTDGGGAITPRPPIVSNSWRAFGCIGNQAANYIGSEVNAIAVDQEVFSHNQLYAFCAGNEGNCNSGCGVARTIGDPATAKNTLAVGMVNDYVGTEGDPGSLNCGSSRGPAGDGRWKPNVVASGCSITSVDGSTTSGYSQKCGCSMATPITSAILSAAAERYPELRTEGALARAWAMGTAVTWQDATAPGSWGYLSPAHTFNYGLGRISALKAVEGGGGLPWVRNWGWNSVGTAPVTYDISVSAGCTRLVVVLTWNDLPPALGANPVIVKDVDLYVDREPFDPAGNVGDYWSNSTINSVEYVFVNNPPVGNYRIKVYPYTTQDTVRFGMMACQLYGDTTPAVTISGAASRRWIQPGQSVSVPLTIAAADAIATNVYLSNTSNGGFWRDATFTTLRDGTALTNRDSGGAILLGDTLRGNSRPITYTFTDTLRTDRDTGIGFQTRSDNGGTTNASVPVGVDGTPPPQPSNPLALTHTPGVWSNTRAMRFSYVQLLDNLSGVQGMATGWAEGTPVPVPVSPLLPHTGYLDVTAPQDSSGLWFGIRSVDLAGNPSPSSDSGPFLLDTVLPEAAADLACSTHAVGVWSADPNANLTWTAAVDDRSGLDGYSWSVSAGGPEDPGTTPNLGPAEVNLPTVLPGSGSWWFNLRSKDLAGNWSAAPASLGPVQIDVDAPHDVTLTIDGGAGYGTSLDVALDLAALDDHSGVTEMRFQNDGGNWSAWEPFAVIRAWNLTNDGGSSATGTRTVWLEVRDGAGNTTPAYDSIYYYVPVAAFGDACAGSEGLPTFAISGIPGIGYPISFDIGNTAAPTAYVWLGLSNAVWNGLPLPYDLEPFGVPGCALNVSLDVLLYLGPPGSVPFVIPSEPALAGQVVHFQTLLFGDPGGRLVVTTQGLTLTIAGS
jgi:hypothetical protein